MPKFVPVADAVERLQRGVDPECKLFQKIAEQGHYGGRPGSRQGTYVAAPNGVLLASVNSNDPVRITTMLKVALAKWETLSREQRMMPEDPQAATQNVKRIERFYPIGGLVLRVNSRDLPRETPVSQRDAAAWNQDFAWFTKEEARQIVPEQPKVGEKRDVPDALRRRIARLHLIDNVRGQTAPFEDREVEKALLTSEVLGVEGNVVTLRLEGETGTFSEGTWTIHGLRDRNPTPQKRGFEMRLRGKAKYDLKTERFTSFDMVALGWRWGGTQYNGRGNDLDPNPIGIAFTLTFSSHRSAAFKLAVS
jgi:hypothetical protein